MEVVGAAASFIAIGQALAGIPKLISIIQTVAGTREELEDLLFELELLSDLHYDIQNCWILLSNSPSGLTTPKEPAYVQRAKAQLESLLAQVRTLASDCQTSIREKHLGKSLQARAKWVWKRQKVTAMCERARRIQECLKSAIDLLSFRYSLEERTERIAQTKLLLEVHAVTTAGPLLNGPLDDNRSSQEREIVSKELPTPWESQYWLPDYHGPICVCSCHKSPKPHQSTMSSLLGLQLTSQTYACSCNCGTSTSTYRLRVNLPRWLARRALAFTTSFSAQGKISVSLHLPALLKDTDVSWKYLDSATELNGLDFIRRNPFSPLDVALDGDTLFEYALREGSWAVVLHWLRSYPNLLSDTDAIRKAAMRSIVSLYNGGCNERIAHIYRVVIDISDLDLNSPFPIHYAIRHNLDLSEAVHENLLAINDQDHTGATPLHVACSYRKYDALNFLIQSGANVHATNSDGDTPLHTACYFGPIACVQALLRAGSDVNIRGWCNRTPLMEAVHDARYDETPELVLLLLQEGASAVHTDDAGWSALHHLTGAIMKREACKICFDALIDAGAKIDGTDHLGFAPLNRSIEHRNTATVRVLLEAGARVDLRTASGANILHRAADWGTEGVLEVLINAQITGLDIRSRNVYCDTPLEILRERIYTRMSDLFPGTQKPTQREVDLFEELLRDVRDRAIITENAVIESIKHEIHEGDTEKARKALGDLTESKRQAQIEWEAETFRAIELDIRNGLLDLAIESLDDFMAVSKARLDVSPFDEEENRWEDDDSGESYYSEEGSIVETLSDDEDGQEDEDNHENENDSMDRSGDDDGDSDASEVLNNGVDTFEAT